MAHRISDDYELEIVTPLDIPLRPRSGRWFLGEVDISEMILSCEVNAAPLTGEWGIPPMATLHLDVTNIIVRLHGA